MKILDIVKSHGDIAFVVDEMPVLTYEMMGYATLIGSDESGTFYNVLYHRVEHCGPKAFGGHEFSLPMKNGETFTTDGWWWHGGLTDVEKMLGIKLRRVAIGDLPSLKKCYVFTGQYVDVKKFDERMYQPFLAERGEVEPKDYFEYEAGIRTVGRSGARGSTG